MIECTARVGEELAKMEKPKGGRPEKTGCRQQPVIAGPMTLKELGIDKTEAFRAQKIASIPREKLSLPQDYVLAHMWFSLAASGSNEDAVKQRDTIAKKMTPAQISEAQKMAREWKPK